MTVANLVLAVDVGNTRAKFGLFGLLENGGTEPLGIVARVLTETADLAAALYDWWRLQGVSLPRIAMIAGSDPETRDQILNTWPLRGCAPVVISGYQQIPIGMDVDVPGRVGVDRLLNVFAASRLQEGIRPVIVVDSGTATTVDLMTSNCVFRGGSILPGLRLSAQALHDYTARLPLLSVDEERQDLPEVPGRNTEAAMRAGLFIGQLGAVRELCARLAISSRQTFGEILVPQVFVTGGGGRQLVAHLPEARYIDSLPLHGLALLSLRE